MKRLWKWTAGILACYSWLLSPCCPTWRAAEGRLRHGCYALPHNASRHAESGQRCARTRAMIARTASADFIIPRTNG